MLILPTNTKKASKRFRPIFPNNEHQYRGHKVLIKPRIIKYILKDANPKLDRLTLIIHPSLRKYTYFHSVKTTRLQQPKSRSQAKVKAEVQAPQSPPKDSRKKASINFEGQRIVQNLDYCPQRQASPYPILYKYNTKSSNSYQKREVIIQF